jgi:hypothetical protein
MSDVHAIAIDWSGRAKGEEKTIFLAEATPGELLRVERGRTRQEIVKHLIEYARVQPFVLGMDFAFSMPAWFVEGVHGYSNAPAFWHRMTLLGEQWLSACEPPFWGRPGKKKSLLPEDFRVTEKEVPATRGIRPKSVFQIGGAGAVGTGSIRGMPVLNQLRGAGFSVWPFDAHGLPKVIEIYPRLFTPGVNKSNFQARTSYLQQVWGYVDPNQMVTAASTEDAFDAAVSALVMSINLDEILSLQQLPDPYQIEGAIWSTHQLPLPPPLPSLPTFPEATPPTEFFFLIEGMSSHIVSLEGEWLTYTRVDHGEVVVESRVRPHPRKWTAFTKRLEELGVREWNDLHASSPEAGPSWELRIVRDSDAIHASGTNAFPPDGLPGPLPEFEAFLRAIGSLIGSPSLMQGTLRS